MHDEIRDRVARYERALFAIAANKPAGMLMTREDEDRAAWVVDAIARYEARQVAPAKPPPPSEPVPEAEAAPTPRRRRRRRAPGEAPLPRGRRPRKTQPPPAG